MTYVNSESAGRQSFDAWFSQYIHEEVLSLAFKQEVSTPTSSQNTSANSGPAQDQSLEQISKKLGTTAH